MEKKIGIEKFYPALLFGAAVFSVGGGISILPVLLVGGFLLIKEWDNSKLRGLVLFTLGLLFCYAVLNILITFIAGFVTAGWLNTAMTIIWFVLEIFFILMTVFAVFGPQIFAKINVEEAKADDKKEEPAEQETKEEK